MPNIYAENAALQYGVPAEVMNAVAWAEDAYDATSINASAANLRAEYQKHGNWNDALYAHSMGTTADAERARQFTQTVLEVAGHIPGPIEADNEPWLDKAKRILISNPEATRAIQEGQGTYSHADTFIGKVISNGGIVILGIVIIGIAILSIPQVRGAAKTVATKGAA